MFLQIHDVMYDITQYITHTHTTTVCVILYYMGLRGYSILCLDHIMLYTPPNYSMYITGYPRHVL